MSEYLIQGETLQAIADKIREKLGVDNRYSIITNVTQVQGQLIPGSVIPYYREMIDANGGGGIGDGNYVSTDVFIAYEYLEDINGNIVPVIYKTDVEGDEPDIPDYADKFFYMG